MCPARLYIADEHESVRSALAERLDRASDLIVIGQSGDANETLREIQRDKPDVVLVEVKRSDGLGLEIVRQFSIHRGWLCSLLMLPNGRKRRPAEQAQRYTF